MLISDWFPQVDLPPSYVDVTPGSPAPSYKSDMGAARPESPTPTTGLRVQACGDCHLLNFGLFATPERNLIFDINDFDETAIAP